MLVSDCKIRSKKYKLIGLNFLYIYIFIDIFFGERI